MRRVLRPLSRMRATADSAGLTGLFGLFFGALALVGVQIVLVIGVWFIFAKLLNRPFHVAIAMVLTGITNPLTVTPVYTLYFVTGCSVTACGLRERAVETLVNAVLSRGDISLVLDSLHLLGITLLGSLFYAIPLGLLGLVAGRQIGDRLQRRRAERAARKRRSIKPIDAMVS